MEGGVNRRRAPGQWLFLTLLWILACTPPVLQTEDASEEPAQPNAAATIRDLNVPSNYHGPVDPQWPPTRSSELEVELSTNRLILEHLEQREKKGQSGRPRVIINTSKVYAEKGKIGGFEYIEVILGDRGAPDEDLPLAVLLHGRGGRPTIPPGPYLTDQPLRLFIPQGPDRMGDGYHWLATWTNSGNEELLARSLAARADELAAAIKAFSELRPTLGRPMLIGFSQGAILCFGLAIRHPTLFSAVFPFAGWLPASLIPTETDENIAYPLIYAQHGEADRVVGVERGRKTADLLRLFGFPIEFEVHPGAKHEVTRVMNQNVRARMRALSKRFFEARNQSLEPGDDLLEPEFWPVPDPNDAPDNEPDGEFEEQLGDNPEDKRAVSEAAPRPFKLIRRANRKPPPEPRPEPESLPKFEAESEPESLPESEAASEPNIDGDFELDSESAPISEPQAEADIHYEVQPEPDIDSEIEFNTEDEATPETDE
jgi:phospholipase/carboxylesterase